MSLQRSTAAYIYWHPSLFVVVCVAEQNLRHFVVVDRVNPTLRRKREVLVLGSCRPAEWGRLRTGFRCLEPAPLWWKQEEPELNQALAQNWLWNRFVEKRHENIRNISHFQRW